LRAQRPPNICLTCAARSAKRIGATFAERSDSKSRDKGQVRLKQLLGDFLLFFKITTK